MIKAVETHAIGDGHASDGDGNGNGHGTTAPPKVVRVRVLRQDVAGGESYWERFEIPHEPNLNVISVLQKIAALGTSLDGRKVAPVAWDCSCLEEVCGSCTMLINGRTRMACSALVDTLLGEGDEIELRPTSSWIAAGSSGRWSGSRHGCPLTIPTTTVRGRGSRPRSNRMPTRWPSASRAGAASRPARSSRNSNRSSGRASRPPTSRSVVGPSSTAGLSGPTRSARRCSSTVIPPVA
jgi:hypothetical protein